MLAIRLFNTNDSECAFEEGVLPDLTHFKVDYFFIDSGRDGPKSLLHPAPRQQYVLTVKGKLKFTVTNGDSFVIEPGVILIAEDVKGRGHRWELLEGDDWQRLYIVPKDSFDDSQFVATSIQSS